MSPLKEAARQEVFPSSADILVQLLYVLAYNHLTFNDRHDASPVETGLLPVHSPPPARARSDIKADGSGLSARCELQQLWHEIGEEAACLSGLWDGGQHEWRVPLDDDKWFVIRLTDAASPHTSVRLPRVALQKQAEINDNLQTYSAMIMVWFGVETQSNTHGEPRTSLDFHDQPHDAVSFFSNQHLIAQFAQQSPAVQQALAQAITQATRLLKNQLRLDPNQASDWIDININIGSRSRHEIAQGAQPGAQSGLIGHFVVVYNPPEERQPHTLPQAPATAQEILKTIDPWIELLMAQFGEGIVNIARTVLRQAEATRDIPVVLKQAWDGLDLSFPSAGVSIAQAETVVSVLYNTFSDIQKASAAYHRQFLTQSEGVVCAWRDELIDMLHASGATGEQADSYCHFLESLAPTYAEVARVAQASMFDERKQRRLDAIHKKMVKRNSPEAIYKRERSDAAFEERLHQLDEAIRQWQTQSTPEAQGQVAVLQRQVSRLRTRYLAARLIRQRVLDPSQPGRAVFNALPQHKLTAISKITAFTLEPQPERVALGGVNTHTAGHTGVADETELRVTQMRFAFSGAGRGGWEVTNDASVIRRSRPT